MMKFSDPKFLKLVDWTRIQTETQTETTKTFTSRHAQLATKHCYLFSRLRKERNTSSIAQSLLRELNFDTVHRRPAYRKSMYRNFLRDRIYNTVRLLQWLSVRK